MCGIAGVFNYGAPADVNERLLIAMRDTMTHRGPDGEGLFISPDRRLGLAHRRLAILDVSANGAQPMASRDGRYRIVYNGEVYNFRELRRELEAEGARFVSATDTEVLLALFERHGLAMLGRLRGMFAFAIWDSQDRRLFMARDRVGVKPLYYATSHGRFIFASEIKAILEVPGFSRQVDTESLYHYLSFLTAPAPRTMFSGVLKLEPGHTLTVDSDGTIRTHRYWDAFDETTRGGGAAVADRILEKLRESVRYRMVSDVPFGVFLSGGIDSSANVALMAELMDAPVETFSIGFEGQDEYNEFEYARIVANRFGTNHHEVRIGMDDLVGFLPDLIQFQDEPIADPVCVPVYFVAKLAKAHGVTVCQVGEGSDELFCGYPYWAAVLKAERLSHAAAAVPLFMRALAPAGLKLLGYGDTRQYELARRGAVGEDLFWGGAEAFSESQKRRMLSPDLLRELGPITSYDVVRHYRRQFESRSPSPSDRLAWMTYLDLQLRLPELLLMRVDKMTMGASVEARVPFLDHELVSLVIGLTQNVKIPGGRLKHLLKEAVGGLLPREIVDRPKQGFRVPVNEWLLEGIGPTADAVLDDFTRRHPYLRADYKQQFDRPLDGAKTWYLLNLALWHRHWIEQRPMPESVPMAASA